MSLLCCSLIIWISFIIDCLRIVQAYHQQIEEFYFFSLLPVIVFYNLVALADQ
jgi:fumarate reductase subunit C